MDVDPLDDLRARDEVALIENVLLQFVEERLAAFDGTGAGDLVAEFVERLVALVEGEPVLAVVGVRQDTGDGA